MLNSTRITGRPNYSMPLEMHIKDYKRNGYQDRKSYIEKHIPYKLIDEKVK